MKKFDQRGGGEGGGRGGGGVACAFCGESQILVHKLNSGVYLWLGCFARGAPAECFTSWGGFHSNSLRECGIRWCLCVIQLPRRGVVFLGGAGEIS